MHEVVVADLHMKGWLGVARYMGHNTLEYLRLVGCSRSQFRVQVLELDLFPAEVISESAEGTPFIFFTSFVSEGMLLYALPHGAGVLIQRIPHLVGTTVGGASALWRFPLGLARAVYITTARIETHDAVKSPLNQRVDAQGG